MDRKGNEANPGSCESIWEFRSRLDDRSPVPWMVKMILVRWLYDLRTSWSRILKLDDQNGRSVRGSPVSMLISLDQKCAGRRTDDFQNPPAIPTRTPGPPPDHNEP
jgi:hypothetical protein